MLFTFLVALGLWLSLQGNEATPRGQDPTVDEIVERYEGAIGGKSALDRVGTRVWKGTSENRRMGLLPGKLEVRVDSSGKWVLTQWAWGGKRVYEQTFDGSEGFVCWQGKNQPEPINPDTVAENNVMFGVLQGRRLFDRLTDRKFVGKEVSGDLETHVIEGRFSDGTAVRAYFDTKSGLLMRFDFGRGSASRNSAIFFEDFREVNGVKVPFVIQLYKLESVFLMKFEKVEHNARVDPKAFEKPRRC